MLHLDFTTQKKAQCVNWYNQKGSETQTKSLFLSEYQVNAPVRNTILAWNEKIIQTKAFVIGDAMNDLQINIWKSDDFVHN